MSRPRVSRQNISRWNFTDSNKKTRFYNDGYKIEESLKQNLKSSLDTIHSQIDNYSSTVNTTQKTVRPQSSTCKRTNHFYIGIERKILNAEYENTSIIPHTKLKEQILGQNEQMLEQVQYEHHVNKNKFIDFHKKVENDFLQTQEESFKSIQY